jgi:hypothetical protein
LPAVSGTYTITITNPDGQTTTIPITIDSALPVELLSFDAKAANSNCILHWETASEINNDYFTIQRSVDGNTFEDVGKVKGAGNSTSIIDYTYIDKNPVCSTCYYRLNQVDYDGKSSLSKIIRVNFESSEFALSATVVDYENNSIKIYLNSSRDENVVYRICDLPGRIISSGSKTTGKGTNTIEIDTKYFSHGIYFLSLNNEEKILSEKIFY